MKRYIPLLVCFLITHFDGYGQYDASPQVIDSLLNALQKSPIDSSRTPILVDLWRAHINRDIDKAFGYADQLIDLGRKLDNVPIQHTGYQRMGIAYSYIDDYPSSNTYYRKAIKLSEKAQEYSSTAAMQINIAINHSIMSQHDSTLLYANKSMENFAKKNDSTGIAACYNVIAGMHFSKGAYRLSLENNIKAMDIYERYDDRNSLKDAMRGISRNYLKMRDTANAINYLLQLEQMNRQDNDKHGIIASLTNLGNIYLNKKDSLETAKKQYDESWELSQSMKFPLGQINTLFGLGRYYQLKSEFPEAKTYFKRSLFLADSIGQTGNVVVNQIHLAEISTEESALEEGASWAQKALSLATENELLENQAKAYQLLSEIASKQNKEGLALTYFKEYKTVNDSIYNIENGQRLSELQTIYETEKKEAEIALQEEEINTLNAQAEVDQLTKGLYAGGMASALALSGLLVFGFRQRMKKNKVEREKQEEIYRQEIAHKKKELTSQTLHLVQKNTFIQELKENLENIKSSPEKFKTEFRRIVMLLRKENASDKDWEIFKTYFAEVHNDFDQKLKTLYPDISEKEIRLAAFLRMNLTTKEIAATLNVLPDSILKSKYRLKKKLRLDKDTDLNDFLNSL
jgi:tetratricopeptide (TPR) repeat protein/DNA-binding CsgD family transcriptional regulator|nr:tetratricopeptide repeat protein [Allomuricauda sp.]